MDEQSTKTPTGVGRRRVLSGAAWAVPAVIVASAAPAAATSATPASLSLAASSFTASGLNSVLTLVAANGGGSTAGSLTAVSVDIAVPASKVAPSVVASSGTGWTLTGPTTSGGQLIYVATYSGSIARGSSATLSVTFAPAGDDPYPVTAALSGRATASGTTVTATASPTRAGAANALMQLSIAPRSASGGQHKYIQVTVPAGMTLTGVTLVIRWTPSTVADTSSKVTISGWNRSFVPNQPTAGMRTTTLTAPSAVSGAFELDFHSPIAIANAADFTIVVTATASGSTEQRTRTFTGEYA